MLNVGLLSQSASASCPVMPPPFSTLTFSLLPPRSPYFPSSSVGPLGPPVAERQIVRRYKPRDRETPLATVHAGIDPSVTSVSLRRAAYFQSRRNGCVRSSTRSSNGPRSTRRIVLIGRRESEPIMNDRREPSRHSGGPFQTLQCQVSSQTTRNSPRDHRRGKTRFSETPCLPLVSAPSTRLTRRCSGHFALLASLARSCR
jgi:hypothetical protein